LSRVQRMTALAGYLAKPAIGQHNGPRNLVSGREKACVADHARGVNWPFLSPRRRSSASPSSFDKLSMRGSTARRFPERRTRPPLLLARLQSAGNRGIVVQSGGRRRALSAWSFRLSSVRAIKKDTRCPVAARLRGIWARRRIDRVQPGRTRTAAAWDARLFARLVASELAEDRLHRGAVRRDCLASPGG
jgi:hypothetical protein